MENKWVIHVKNFAKENGLNYREALYHPDIKKDYVKVSGGSIKSIGKAFNKSLKKTSSDFNKSIKKTGTAFKDIGSDIKDTYEDAEDIYYDSAKYYKKNLRSKISPVLDSILEHGGPLIENAVATSLQATLISQGVPPQEAKIMSKMAGKLTVTGLKEAKKVSGLGVNKISKPRVPKVSIGKLIDGHGFRPG